MIKERVVLFSDGQLGVIVNLATGDLRDLPPSPAFNLALPFASSHSSELASGRVLEIFTVFLLFSETCLFAPPLLSGFSSDLNAAFSTRTPVFF